MIKLVDLMAQADTPSRAAVPRSRDDEAHRGAGRRVRRDRLPGAERPAGRVAQDARARPPGGARVGPRPRRRTGLAHLRRRAHGAGGRHCAGRPPRVLRAHRRRDHRGAVRAGAPARALPDPLRAHPRADARRGARPRRERRRRPDHADRVAGRAARAPQPGLPVRRRRPARGAARGDPHRLRRERLRREGWRSTT